MLEASQVINNGIINLVSIGETISIWATFIIDKQGTLQYARRGSYFGDRPSVADGIAELKKLSN